VVAFETPELLAVKQAITDVAGGLVGAYTCIVKLLRHVPATYQDRELQQAVSELSARINKLLDALNEIKIK
jgi:hypothetical protein